MAMYKGSHRTTLGHTKKKKPRMQQAGGKAYNPKEHVKGVEHYVEGRSNLQYKPVYTRASQYRGSHRTTFREPDLVEYPADKRSRKNAAYNKGIDKQIAQFGLIDEARAKLRTIVDPQETALNERKRAARRRMRGRLGTMLSGQRETLA